jgi:hypothetical protein
MSDSDLPDGAPQSPELAEAFTKLRTATEILKKLNEETQAAADAPIPDRAPADQRS